MNDKEKYIKEMLEEWRRTRSSGIPGTRAWEPDNFEEIIGKYYDEHVVKA